MELRTMEQMIPEYLEPCLRKGTKYKGLCKAARAERDFETIETFAPIPVIHEQVEKAMLVLQALAALVVTGVRLNEAQSDAANVAIVLIIFLNGFAGRSQEWEHMKRADLLKQIDAKQHGGRGLNYAIGKVHKTVLQYGDAGKALFPDTIRALLVYFKEI